MKSFIKRVVVIMAIMAVCLGGLSNTPEVSAKKKEPRYTFGGEYVIKKKNGETWKLVLSEFSSPEGKEVGSMDIYFKASHRDTMVLTGFTDFPIKKTRKKNTYKCTDLTIRVYKKKIKVSGDDKGGCNGIYRLKKRYVS